MENVLRERLRRLPGVDAVLAILAAEPLAAGPELVASLVRRVIGEVRREVIAGGAQTAFDPRRLEAEAIASRVRERFGELTTLRPQPVINATGVMVHTNLGRAPLSELAAEHLARVASGYTDLEYDLEAGERGSRQDHVGDLLCLLTDSEDALVVNNNAAAVMLMLAALARGREVILSRGEMVEIGGSFRVPEVLEQSGARLREIGTTNRTHLRDYEAAIGPETGLILKVHTSNYRVEGFTASVGLKELVELGRSRGIPVATDWGSGAFTEVGSAGIRPEPRTAELIATGADVVTCSGDKLLGGPQAGIAVGTAEAIGRMRKHPLARAVRIDKLLLAALQATLVAYLEPGRARREIPVLRQLFTSASEVRVRAEKLAQSLAEGWGSSGPRVIVEESISRIGGGSLPQEGVPTHVVAIDPRPHCTAARLERALRHARPALVGRIQDEKLLLDLRTVTTNEEGRIPGLLRDAWTVAVAKGA